MTRPVTAATASAYGAALDDRFRQSSSGPLSSARARATTISASDTDARRHRFRVRARSAESSVAVKRRAPEGAATSNVPAAGVVRAASNRSSIETGANRLSYRKASASEREVDGELRDRSAATVPTRWPAGVITGATYTSRRPSAPWAKNQASSPCNRSGGSSEGRPSHASGPLRPYAVSATSSSL